VSPANEVRVPLFVTRAEIAALLDEVADRQRAVLESGRYVLGPELDAFEREFAASEGREHCVGVANGTDALTIALRATGVGPGDEVVIPSVTFFATAEAVVNAGAKPVPCDIDASTHCMTASTAEPAIGPTTRALVPVHLFGNPAPMRELRELATAHDLVLIADAAQAAGARLYGAPAGSHGDAATFSFYPGKNLGAFGDGGAIVTDDAAVADMARSLRHHGQAQPWVHSVWGYNSRLDEIQATALRALLPHLGEWTKARRAAASAYIESDIADLVSLPAETEGAESAYHLFVVGCPDRDAVSSSLAASGIESRAYYTTPMHLQPALADQAQAQKLPSAERLAREGLALPMGQGLDPATVEQVVGALVAATAGSQP
jgi:dTDP-4-amino-4,6-dideoxygalactose transaminase